MRYGSIEYAYAEPLAAALVQDETFRRGLLNQTRFADRSDARLLHDEMQSTRSAVAQNWWRSHYTETCRCPGCRGQETDILALFEDQSGHRFAIHCEVKQPNDNFPSIKSQAINYNLRAKCWTRQSPPKVPAHNDADTLLFCSKFRIGDYGENVTAFGAVVTFQQISKAFPEIGARLGKVATSD